ncbi:ABC transporter ATP-binding protein/permease [Paracoccaceae bacterium]|nr:ABC transporter ATP-binding protein/permease [Paracoccaceae bacterium]
MRISSYENEEPTATEKKEDYKAIFLTTFRYLWPDELVLRIRVITSLVCLVLAKVFTVLTPLLLMTLVDELNLLIDNTQKGNLVIWGVLALALGYGAARFSSIAFVQIRDFLFVNVAQNGLKKLSMHAFQHMHSLPLSFHLSRQTGSMNKVIDRGVRGIEFLLRFVLFSIGPLILEFIFVCILMIYKFDEIFLLIILATIFVYVLFTIVVTNWRVKIRRKMNLWDADLSQKTIDSLLNYETVKYFSAENHEKEKYLKSLKSYEFFAIKTGVSLSMLNFGQALIVTSGLLALIVVATKQVMNGDLSVGGLVGLNAIMLQLILPLNFLGTVYREIRQALVDMSDLFILFKERVEEDEITKNELTSIEKGFIFDNVSFSYDGVREVVKEISLSIPVGKKTAIVGPSGSGKSTLGKLIFGFYKPSRGQIFIDGQDNTVIKTNSLRAQLAVTPQDIVLFNDTLEYNITYGSRDVSKEMLNNVIEKADLANLVSKLPIGLLTKVGERGLKLSGGEKQRVAIARMLLKKCDINILDEATSSLDPKSEKRIIENLLEKRTSKTLIIISHRLSSISGADNILVIDNGQLVQQGKHDRLIQENGLYKEMWDKQKRYQDRD